MVAHICYKLRDNQVLFWKIDLDFIQNLKRILVYYIQALCISLANIIQISKCFPGSRGFAAMIFVTAVLLALSIFTPMLAQQRKLTSYKNS